MTDTTHSEGKSSEAGRLMGFTRGEAVVTKHGEWDKEIPVEVGGSHVAFVYADDIDHDEAEANAALIAEAFTVANETGLTPRELAAQCAMLVEALKPFAALPYFADISDEHADTIIYRNAGASITVADVRSAKSALSRATPPQTEGK